LERNPHLAGDPPPNLDLIDRLGLSLVGDFQRRAACIEEDHVTAVVLPGGQLLEAQRVSEKCRRAIKVLHGQDES